MHLFDTHESVCKPTLQAITIYIALHMADVVTAVWPETSLILHSSEVGEEMLWLDKAASH